MAMQTLTLTAALLAAPLAALAQPATEPDRNCKWDTPAQTRTLASGRTAILNVKQPGPVTCKSVGGCTNEVEVQSFNRFVGGALACCVRIEYGRMEVAKRNPNVKLRWKLKSTDGNSYIFNSNSVYIIPPPSPTPDDLDAPTLNGARTMATINSVNKWPVTFNYGVSVSLKKPGGGYLDCDPNDPVIVNQGN